MGVRLPLPGGGQNCPTPPLASKAEPPRPTPGWGPTMGCPGNETGANGWLYGVRNMMQKQADFLDCNLAPPPPRVGPGGTWRGRGAAGSCGFEIQATSCPRRGSSTAATPAVCWPPPQPFDCGEPILPSATEAIPSLAVLGNGEWWGQRVEAPEQSKGSACPFGTLGNTRLRCPEEMSISSGWCLGTQCPDI